MQATSGCGMSLEQMLSRSRVEAAESATPACSVLGAGGCGSSVLLSSVGPLLVERDLCVVSTCEHHLLPFFGGFGFVFRVPPRIHNDVRRCPFSAMPCGSALVRLPLRSTFVCYLQIIAMRCVRCCRFACREEPYCGPCAPARGC